MLKSYEVDVAVIGAGTAGLTAFRAAQKQGARAVLIESGPYGTTCARVGCMPSKLLIQAADAAHEVSRAGQFGVEVPSGVRVNGRAVMERVRRERDRFVGFVVDQTTKIAREERIKGHARFLGPSTLEVDEDSRVEARVEAGAIVIATGSSPWVPPSLDAVRDRVLTTNELFELYDLPASVAVVGTGIIGMELGQALHRLGVRTAFFSPFNDVCHVTDPKIQARVCETFDTEMDLNVEHESFQASPADGGVRIQWRLPDGRSGDVVFEQVLVAAGRRPNIGDLNLEATGLELTKNGGPVYDRRTLQCGESSIFVAGDACSHYPLLHEAADDGRIAGANAAAFPQVRAHLRRLPLSIVFTDPQIALVGKNYVDFDPDSMVCGEASYDDQGRARVMGKNSGLVRLYAGRERGCLLGAEMFGPRMEHMAHLLAWAIESRLSVDQILAMPFYHPVLEEGLRTALRSITEQLKLMAPLKSERLNYGPGT